MYSPAMAKKEEKKTAITVELPQGLRERIDSARALFGMSLTAFVERAAEAYAERLEGMEAP